MLPRGLKKSNGWAKNYFHFFEFAILISIFTRIVRINTAKKQFQHHSQYLYKYKSAQL